jgi:hypothetical protein
MKNFITPRGIRIPVSSVKGRCPGPLDDGGFFILKKKDLFVNSIIDDNKF